jgi:hypothetical protein
MWRSRLQVLRRAWPRRRRHPLFFSFLRDHPKVTAIGLKTRDWSNALNIERNWLKHAGPNHPPAMEFHHALAAIMLLRAITRAQATFSFESEVVRTFASWVSEHYEEIFVEGQGPPADPGVRR